MGCSSSASTTRTRVLAKQGQHSESSSHGDLDVPPEQQLDSTTDEALSERLDESTAPMVKNTRGPTVNNRPKMEIDYWGKRPASSTGGGIGARHPCKDHVRYLHIPRHSLKDFQRFARDAAVEAQRELAADNPYVQALVNYRAEMQAFAVAPVAVPSVEQMLSTQRENLSVLSPVKATSRSLGDDVMQSTRALVEGEFVSVDNNCMVWCDDGSDWRHRSNDDVPATKESLEDPSVVVCSAPAHKDHSLSPACTHGFSTKVHG